MFEMKITSQFNMSDRTMICGVPNEDYSVPQKIIVGEKTYRVLGISQGSCFPYLSLEIVKTNDPLIGMVAFSRV